MGGRALRALCASASWAARGLVADAAPAAALAGNPFVLESSNSRASMHAEASSRGAAGDPRQSTPPPPRLWPWALSGAAALACASAVIAESPSQGAEGPASRSDRAEGLRAFLSRIGVDLRGLSLGPSPSAGASNDDMGILFTDEARRRVLGSAAWRAASWVLPWTWFGSATLATFPLPATISADSAASDPVFGGAISECMAAGLADERVALAMYLAMHRSLGAKSPLYDYLRALPETTDAPLMWSEQELEEIRGTPLFEAASAMRAAVQRQWERFGPLMREAVRAASASQPSKSPSVASSTTSTSSTSSIPSTLSTSSIPSTASATTPSSTQSISSPPRDPRLGDLLWAHAMVASRAVGLPTGPHGAEELALVPGLDFANHRTQSPFRWELVPSPDLSWERSRVALVGPRRAVWALRSGDEIRIDYGDRGQEAMLFAYGMLSKGPGDRWDQELRLAFPLPGDRDEWDEVTKKRVDLLEYSNILPGVAVGACPADTAELRGMTGEQALSALSRAASPGSFAALRVFTLLETEIDALHSAMRVCQERGTEFRGLDWGDVREWEGGDQMAVLTLVRLLEVRWGELEGEAGRGTGSLESDVALLERGQLPLRLRLAVTYRAHVKRAAREWVVLGRRALAHVMERARGGGEGK